MHNKYQSLKLVNQLPNNHVNIYKKQIIDCLKESHFFSERKKNQKFFTLKPLERIIVKRLLPNLLNLNHQNKIFDMRQHHILNNDANFINNLLEF